MVETLRPIREETGVFLPIKHIWRDLPRRGGARGLCGRQNTAQGLQKVGFVER